MKRSPTARPIDLGIFTESRDRLFDTTELDELRQVVVATLKHRFDNLDHEHLHYADFDGKDEHDFRSYQYQLEIRWQLGNEVLRLSGELVLVALYRQVELHLKRVTGQLFPDVDVAAFYKADALKKAFPFVRSLPSFQAFDELRLLNNSIKHTGCASSALAKAFPAWTSGNELKELAGTYDRLRPLVGDFVKSFVERVYLEARARRKATRGVKHEGGASG